MTTMFRATSAVLFLLLLGLAAVDGIWCDEECRRAAEASGTRGGSPAALSSTCLYCPPGLTLARVTCVPVSKPLGLLETGGQLHTSDGIIPPIEHPPRAL